MCLYPSPSISHCVKCHASEFEEWFYHITTPQLATQESGETAGLGNSPIPNLKLNPNKHTHLLSVFLFFILGYVSYSGFMFNACLNRKDLNSCGSYVDCLLKNLILLMFRNINRVWMQFLNRSGYNPNHWCVFIENSRWIKLLCVAALCASLCNKVSDHKHPEFLSSRPGGKPDHTYPCCDWHHSCRECDQSDSDSRDSQQHDPGLLCVQHFDLWALCTGITIRQQWVKGRVIWLPAHSLFLICDGGSQRS